MIDFIIIVLAMLGGSFTCTAVQRRSLKDGLIGLALLIVPTTLNYLLR